jgi:hypothetical protein
MNAMFQMADQPRIATLAPVDTRRCAVSAAHKAVRGTEGLPGYTDPGGPSAAPAASETAHAVG